MITKEQQMRFILEDEPNRMKREYKGEILNIYHNSSEQYPILNDTKDKVKTIGNLSNFYKRKGK